MSQQNKLMGVGQSAAAAAQIVGDVASGLTAAGTGQSSALSLSCSCNYVETVASGTGVRLYGSSGRPSSIGDEQTVYNTGANALSVYPPSGEQIVGAAQDAVFSLPVGVSVTFKKVKNALWLVTSGDAAFERFVQSGIGAVSGTVQGEFRSLPINAVTQFGLSTSGTAAANYTALSNALTAALGKMLYIPAGTFNIDPSPGILTVGCVMFGAGRNATILNIAGSGDVFQRSTASVIRDLSLRMNGATYSGHGCKFAASTSDQMDMNIDITNAASAKQALLFEADGGSEFHSFGSAYYSLGSLGSVAAVKVNGTDSSACPRKFYGTISSGGTLFDFGGANNFFASGFYTNGLIFGAGSSHVMLNNFRNGATGGTVTIKGSQHVLSGISAAAIINQATSSIINVQAPSWNITESGTGNSLLILSQSYTPTITMGTSGTFAIGNGTMTGKTTRRGNRVTDTIDLLFGSTTTYGTGEFRFSLSNTPYASGGNSVGVAHLLDASAPLFHVAAAFQNPAVAYLVLRGHGAAAVNVGAAEPWAWAQNDRIVVAFEYEVP